jgi:RNA polymerase sigma factor (sigma-70 family)
MKKTESLRRYGPDVEGYLQYLAGIQIPTREQVAEAGRQMLDSRTAFRIETLRCRQSLQQCSLFLAQVMQKSYRWDFGFEVSQKESERIGQIRDSLSPISKNLNRLLQAFSGLRISADHDIIEQIETLSIRICHVVRWFFSFVPNQPGLCQPTVAMEHYSNYIAAKQQLADSCMKLVVKIAHQYSGSGQSLMETIQNGHVGLMIAAEKYDYRKGFTFTSYSANWIRQTIRLGLQNSRLIRIPADKLNRLSKCMTQLESHSQNLGCSLRASEEVAIFLKHNLDEQVFLGFHDQPVSLEQLKTNDANRAVEIADPKMKDPTEGPDRELIQRKLAQAFQTLDQRQRLVLSLRFGLDGNESHTLSRIAKRIGITHQRTQQIQAASLKILQSQLSKYS